MKALFYSTVFFAIISAGCADSSVKQNKTTHMDSSKKDNLVYSNTDSGKVNISNDEWKKILPDNVYNIAREKGTERAFTGKYWDHKEGGTYYCAACGNPLFNSNGKFESSCGWPSF